MEKEGLPWFSVLGHEGCQSQRFSCLRGKRMNCLENVDFKYLLYFRVLCDFGRKFLPDSSKPV